MKSLLRVAAFGLTLAYLGAPATAAASPQAPHVNWLSFDYKADPHKGPPLAMALLNFAVLTGLLTVLFGPKLRKFLLTRHDTIKRDLEEGRRLRDEAMRKLREYETKLAGVDAEVAKLIGEIRRQAEDDRARIIADAEAHAAKVKRDAEDRIAAELDRARRLLEREVVDAAIAAAAKILQTSATPADQTQMVDDFIGDVQNRVEAPL
jgi:F-type H+-transporting ATPase subunit b